MNSYRTNIATVARKLMNTHSMVSRKPLLLDGRTGEGGGQLVRIACALAAVTSQPIRIDHVRGNRPGHRGGGLKAQHVSAIQWLAEATGAEVEGLAVGSHTLEFRPSLPPTALAGRNFKIIAGNTASSTLLVFQAIFPFLLFAGNESGEPIELEIHGGTNVSFSPSYEYLDQVLLPILQDRFGITVERQLKKRAWAVGPQFRGCIKLKFHPLAPGQSLKLLGPWNKTPGAEDFRLKRVDVSILVPTFLREPLEKALTHEITKTFPDVDIQFVFFEDSRHGARLYTLLVAHSQTGLRWGHDYMYNRAWKKKTPDSLSAEISRKACRGLLEEVTIRGVVDEHLQDQLVVFQALADGRTSFPRSNEPADDSAESRTPNGPDYRNNSLEDRTPDDNLKKDSTHEPFGDGSTHTTTARWVVSELLPTVQWFNKGAICDGACVSFPSK
ncbi:EPT/RTPC-like protein [Annulohypoxylon maeteangense]|uniref:EPT/RTPC-like protein n=1 Tax=Annulohypoxylon maeteangense TaxID=1927788 RepID=UPI002008D61C|nr:EPT/RTPC-like protein [Annulohypoxylon maeteangense]KAI0886185.1 EPT/RTPC-like protein [Annulohypoxylon maeteangense]